MKQVTDIPALPPRPTDGHKGTFGTVIVIGGCDTMIGAPALCARAALRSGVGLVKAACPPAILPHVLTIEPGATGIAIGNEPDDVIAQLDQADPGHKAVLAVGPGLGQGTVRGELVEALLTGPRTVVLDADGLNLMAKNRFAIDTARARITPLVLTPHPGEYKRLADAMKIQADPVGDDTQRATAASLLASKLQAVVVLKGKNSVIADGERVALNPSGNPALATAGSGDVLTGLIASLLAQGMHPFDAAQLGAYLHGKAADLWADQYGSQGLRAIELADQLPLAFQEIQT